MTGPQTESGETPPRKRIAVAVGLLLSQRSPILHQACFLVFFFFWSSFASSRLPQTPTLSELQSC